MNIAIVGSRNFPCPNFVKEKVYSLFSNFPNKFPMLISGGAKGVDSWAEEIVDDLGIKKIIFKPDWDKYGKSAGFRRNQLIVKEATHLWAFWDGKSKGTKHSIELAVQKGIPVDIYIRG